MVDRKSCIRCERGIDEHAKTCPFCNWDQTQPLPPRDEASEPPLYVPPPRRPWWGGKVLGAVAFVALVIIAFVIGMLIHGFEPGEVKAAQTKNADMSTTAHRSNVTLVPVTGSDMPQSIEQPITTAPAQAAGEQPNDATALPADQYAAAAARAKAEREAAEKTQRSMIDPRTITGSVYEPSQRTDATRKTAASSSERPSQNESIEGSARSRPSRTLAYLQYKPLPHIAVDHDITARLNLTVDADGHVTDVEVNEPVPDMAKVIGAVQSWRFKPATENGTPVTSRVAVDITFHANE